MLAGELCDPLDPELVAERERARESCGALNAAGECAQTERRRILHDLFGADGDSVWLHLSMPRRAGNANSESRWKSGRTSGSAAARSYMAGVRSGSRAVIGAGSVVPRDIPAGVFAAGNPCQLIRTLSQP